MDIEFDCVYLDNSLRNPTLIYHNGWYFIAKEVKFGDVDAYVIDRSLEINGFSDPDIAIFYYNKFYNGSASSRN